jgi:hypothetical protein
LEPASEPLGPVDLESRLREARARRTQALAHRRPPDPDGVHPDAAATAPPGPRNSPATTSRPGRKITPAGAIAIVLGILVGGTVTASLAPLLDRAGPTPTPNLSVAILETPTAARLKRRPPFRPSPTSSVRPGRRRSCLRRRTSRYRRSRRPSPG